MEDDWDYTGKVDVSVDDNNIVINSTWGKQELLVFM